MSEDMARERLKLHAAVLDVRMTIDDRWLRIDAPGGTVLLERDTVMGSVPNGQGGSKIITNSAAIDVGINSREVADALQRE